MSANDEVTITVSRDDLADVLYYVRGTAGLRSPIRQPIERIAAAIPAPPWEPSDEQVEAAMLGFSQGVSRWYVISLLKRLHATGLRLP